MDRSVDRDIADRAEKCPERATGTLRVLILSWHAAEGAIGAGGHRRTLQLVERFSRWGTLTIVDNEPPMFEGLPGTAVLGYRLPALNRLAAVDQRIARAVQWPWAAASLVHSARAVTRRNPADAIYVPNSEILPCLVAGVVLRRLLRRPLVLSNMNATGVLLSRLVVALHNRADRVIALSPGLANALIERGLRGRPVVVGCGTPVSEAPAADDFSTEKRWDAVYVGRHTKAKGAMDLLDIWETMRSLRPLGRLAMVGSCTNEMARQIDGRCQRSDLLRGSVVRLGVLGEREKNRVLAASRLLLFPSRAEGWGFVPVEALSRGVPVVCWDLPAYRTSLPCHPAVTRVSVGHTLRFAERALELLDQDDVNLVELALSAPLSMPSWDAVAEQEWGVVASSASAAT